MKFRRQHQVGRYVLHFYCRERRLAVERDGSGHLTALQTGADETWTEWLRRRGIRVLRFPNGDVLRQPAA